MAQYTKEWNPWPMVVDGDTLEIPFWGGINFPKPSLVDFDSDGLADLMVGENRGKVAYFRNTGTAEVPSWSPIQERLGGIDIGSWHTFSDIDADGDPDLFCDALNGRTAFYRNISVGSNIAFELVDTLYGGFQTGFNNTGTFADIDDDGDEDFFWGGATGALTFYRNDGDSANATFTWITDSYDSILAFPGGLAAGPQHGFSTVRFADTDQDGDLDLFYGDIFNFNLYYFENFGSPALSDLTKVSEAYLPITTFGFNHTAFADLDNNVDPDLVVGVASQDFNNLYFLRNELPGFTVVDSNMVNNIDLKSYAVPAIGDLDGDNDMDMLIGSVNGRLEYYENVGSSTSPSFNRVSDFYQGIDVGLSSAPTLTDWDCDGDMDLLIGTDAGKIEFWRNEGSPTNFDPALVNNQLAGIKVDQLATPRAVDFNGDGLRDLIVGEWDFNGRANLRLYQNNGNSPDPTLSLVTDNLLTRDPRDFTLPQVYDWDGDGKPDIILGGRYFGMTWYRNTALLGTFPDSLSLIAQPDVLPGSDDGYRLAIAFGDIDGDGDQDIFLGEEDGGVNFHRRDGVGTLCDCPWQSDLDASGFVDSIDLSLLIDIIFFGDTNPQDPDCPLSRGDFNGDGFTDSIDLSVAIDHIFFGGVGPIDPCTIDSGCP